MTQKSLGKLSRVIGSYAKLLPPSRLSELSSVFFFFVVAVVLILSYSS